MQAINELLHRNPRLLSVGAAHFNIAIAVLTVVDMQAARLNPGRSIILR